MNLANRLTLLRVILIPFFIFFLANPGNYHGEIIALLIFIIASITDFIDGNIARSRNMITDFGKFMDPFADKLLVTSAIIMLVDMNMIPAWTAIIIIAREFAVSGLRTVAAKDGTVIAASGLGKIKTVLQMSAVVGMLLKVCIERDPVFERFRNLSIYRGILTYIPVILIYLAAIMTLVSGIDYFIKGWKAIDPSK